MYRHGQFDDAIRCLERAEALGMEVGKTAMNDDDLDPLRSDPRFQRMRERWRRENGDAFWNKLEKDKGDKLDKSTSGER